MLEVKFSSKAQKFLKKIDSVIWNRLIEKIEKLRKDAFPNDIASQVCLFGNKKYLE